MITDTYELFISCMNILFESYPNAFYMFSRGYPNSLVFNFLNIKYTFPAGNLDGFFIFLYSDYMTRSREEFFFVIENTGFPDDYFFTVQKTVGPAVRR